MSIRGYLEPGETVVALSPPRWLTIPAGFVFFLLPVGATAAVFGAGALEEPIFLAVLGFMVLLGLLLTIIAELALRWRIAVTDRRVLVRQGFMRRRLEEMPRDRIEYAGHHGANFEIHGGGRTIVTELHPALAGRVAALLDTGSAERCRQATIFDRLVEPGEEVVFRGGGATLALLIAVPFLLLAFAAPQFLLAGDVGGILYSMLTTAFFIGLLVFVGITLANADRLWLVTNRRVLAVAGILNRRIEALHLSPDIEAVLEESALIVRNADGMLVLPLKPGDRRKQDFAIRIRDAIEAVKEGQII